MDREGLTIRKTPFLFLKWLVVIELFFALVPFLAVLLINLRQSYEGSPLAGTVPYNLLLTIGQRQRDLLSPGGQCQPAPDRQPGSQVYPGAFQGLSVS